MLRFKHLGFSTELLLLMMQWLQFLMQPMAQADESKVPIDGNAAVSLLSSLITPLQSTLIRAEQHGAAAQHNVT